jgi:hypothetical protein
MVEVVPIAEAVPGPRRSGRVPRPTPEYARFLERARAGLASDEDSEQDIAAIAALLDKTVTDLNTQSDPSVEFHPVDATVLDPYIPIGYRDAMSCPDRAFWKVAINDEHDSIQENVTYIVGPLPPGRKAIKCKWVLDYKPGHKGAAPRYKARLVACGYAQIPNVDYYKVYSPVITHYAIRLVLALAAVMDLEMIQLDIKTAFLYGVLEEEIYMEQPEGFVIPGRESEVCRLLKCLYGLKQASRCWHQLFDEFIRLFGFIRSKYDTCLYYCYGPNGEFTILIIYVDDGLICGNSMAVIESILEYLRTNFQVRSLPASRFVGLDITRDRPNRKLYVNQPDYVKKMLRRYRMDECDPVSVPAHPGNRPVPSWAPTTEEEYRQMERTPYREAIGSLNYLTAMTRLDIALAVNQVSAYVSNPGPRHWEAVKLIFAYLAGTIHHGICFGDVGLEAPFPLQGFTDSDFAADLVTRKSTTGVVFTFYGGPVSWGCRRQRPNGLSTTDAEFYAASEGSREVIWLKSLLLELKVDVGQVPIHCDSKCAISIIEDHENHARVKHVDVLYFHVRENQLNGKLKMVKVSTDDQIADMLTKPLPKAKFERFRDMAGIREVKP